MELVLWLGIIELLWLAAFPLAFFFFRRLTEPGFSFAPALGLLLGAYFVWLSASLGLPFSRISSWLITLLFFGGLNSWLLLRQKKALTRQLIIYFRVRWRIALIAQLVFGMVFLLIIGLRLFIPEIRGSEKFSDYVFFQGMLQSQTMPPNDLWLDGFKQNYYYFGYFIAAYFTQLSGVEPPIAYNLFLATIAGLTAVCAFGLGYSLVNSRKARKAALVAGLLAVLFSCIIGNLDPVRQLAAPGERDKAYCSGLFDNTQCFWWTPVRVIYDTIIVRDEQGQVRFKENGQPEILTAETINEFPSFSFLLGDLHPHVFAYPYFLLVLAFSFNGYRAYLWFRRKAVYKYLQFSLFGLLLGISYFINTWNYPTVLVLFAFTLVWQEWPNRKKWGRLALYLIGLIGASLALIAPFLLNFHTFSGQTYIPAALDYPGLREIARNVGVVTWDKTLLRHHLLIFGFFDYCLLTFLIIKFRPYFRAITPSPPNTTTVSIRTFGLFFAGGLGLLLVNQLLILASFNLTLTLALGLFSLPLLALGTFGLARHFLPLENFKYKQIAFWYGAGLIMLLGFLLKIETLGLLCFALIISGLLFWRESRSTQISSSDKFALLLLNFGVSLLLLLELFYIRDQYETRVNTLFKYYLQIWLLFSVLAAYSLVRLARLYKTFRPLYRISWSVGLLVLISLSLIYPIVGSNARTFQFSQLQGLNGEQWLAQQYPADFAAISWLREQAVNKPNFKGTILEVSGYGYDDTGRVSTFAAFPSLLNWLSHEELWRSYDRNLIAEVQRRSYLTADYLYRTEDIAETEKILRNYQIKYVYVGELEHELEGITETQLNKFAKFMALIYDKAGVQIYAFN